MVFHRLTIRRLILRVLLACVVAACAGTGGEPGTTTTSAPDESQTSEPSTQTTDRSTDLSDPCAYLSASDLETVTGLSFAEGVFNESLSGDRQVICDWIASGSEFATAQILLIPGGADGFETARSGAESVFGLVDTDVPGAAEVYATEEGSIVGMVVGSDFVQVSYIPVGPGKVLDKTTQLAAIVVANLTG